MKIRRLKLRSPETVRRDLRLSALAATLLLAPAGAAAGGMAPVARFIGHWVAAPGTAAAVEQSRALVFSVADDGDGFVIQGMPTGQPDGSDTMTTGRAVFRPTGQADIYRAGDSASPLTGGRLIWARIGAGTLDTTSFVIGHDGAFSLVETDRTLGPDGRMTVTLKRFIDGKPTPVLTGHLERAP